MAEIGLLDIFKGGSGSMIDMLLLGIIVILLAGLVFGIIAFIRWILKYNIRVELLYPKSNGYKRVSDKVKEVKTKEGKTVWEFLKTRGLKNKPIRIKPPSNQYIDINKRGKDVCSFEMINSDTPIPIHPKVKDPDEETLKVSTVSSDDRSYIIDDIESTNALYKDNSISEIISKAMPYIAIVIIVFSMVIFLDQFVETQSQIINKVDSTVDKFVEIHESQQELMKDLTKMKQGTTTKDNEDKPPR